MAFKVMLLIWLFGFCSLVSQVYSDDDDCGADVDLNIDNFLFVLTNEDLSVTWNLTTPTNCTILYHVTVNDSQLGVIVDDYLDYQAFKLDAWSPCINYSFEFRAVNTAVPTPEGPPMRTSILFNSRVQRTPALKSLEVGTTSINTTWLLEGQRNRCPLKNFYVNGGTVFNFTIPLEDLEDTSVVPVVIDSLQPDSMYYFQVAVENSGGISPGYQIAVQTLHE